MGIARQISLIRLLLHCRRYLVMREDADDCNGAMDWLHPARSMHGPGAGGLVVERGQTVMAGASLLDCSGWSEEKGAGRCAGFVAQ
jgi:hypothetical protein